MNIPSLIGASNYMLKRLTGEEPKSEISESSALSNIAKTIVFWAGVLFLGVAVWKAVEQFALEMAFFKAVGIVAGFCILAAVVCFVHWMTTRRERANEKAITNFRR